MAGNERIRLVLQPRDEHLLAELASMRVIDREMAKAVAGFGSTTRANARLLALVTTGLLKRFFQGTKAGGTKALYTLSPKGARFAGVPFNGLRHGKDELVVANFFVAHQLAVNEIYCLAKYPSAGSGALKASRWVNFSEPLVRGIALVPDGYFEIARPQGTIASFLEIDLGHEGLAVWKQKVRNYLRYAASGDFPERFGQKQFRVLVIANTERRREAIRRAVRELTEKIFWFAAFEAIRRSGLWGSPWFRPAEDNPKSFF